MRCFSKAIQFSTSGNSEIVEITEELNVILGESGLREGVMTVMGIGSTCGITTCEFEPGLIKDLQSLLEKLAPQKDSYLHNRAWQDGNAHSHLRASLLGPSLQVPFKEGELILGTWQQVIFIDFDTRPRSRQVFVQLIGE